MPSLLGDLRNLHYLQLNNNSPTGKIPESLSRVGGHTLVDLSTILAVLCQSYLPELCNISISKSFYVNFRISGNSLVCAESSGNNHSVVYIKSLCPSHQMIMFLAGQYWVGQSQVDSFRYGTGISDPRIIYSDVKAANILLDEASIGSPRISCVHRCPWYCWPHCSRVFVNWSIIEN